VVFINVCVVVDLCVDGGFDVLVWFGWVIMLFMMFLCCLVG